MGGNRSGWEEGDGWGRGKAPTERVRDESSHCRSRGLWDQQQCVVRGWQLLTHAAVRRGQVCTGCQRSTLATPLLYNRFKTNNGRRMKSLKPIRPGQLIGHPYSHGGSLSTRNVDQGRRPVSASSFLIDCPFPI